MQVRVKGQDSLLFGMALSIYDRRSVGAYIQSQLQFESSALQTQCKSSLSAQFSKRIQETDDPIMVQNSRLLGGAKDVSSLGQGQQLDVFASRANLPLICIMIFRPYQGFWNKSGLTFASDARHKKYL